MRMNEQRAPREEPTVSEARLRDQIREQLRRHGRVDVTKIGIDVHESQVLLWGSVASESERAVAVEVARSIAGSKNVLNRIHVYRSQAPARRARVSHGAAA